MSIEGMMLWMRIHRGTLLACHDTQVQAGGHTSVPPL